MLFPDWQEQWPGCSGGEKWMTMTTALFLCRIRRIELRSGVSGRWQLIFLYDRTWTVGEDWGPASPFLEKEKSWCRDQR